MHKSHHCINAASGALANQVDEWKGGRKSNMQKSWRQWHRPTATAATIAVSSATNIMAEQKERHDERKERTTNRDP